MTRSTGDLRETLVAEALAMLEAGDELSLRAVARRAGVSAMAPYRHFRDRAALVAAVADRGFAALAQALDAADVQADPREALLAQGIAYIGFARARPHLFRLMFGAEALGASPPEPARAHEAYRILARRAEQAAPAAAQAATLACWSLAHGLATLALDGRLPGLTPERERAALALLVEAAARA